MPFRRITLINAGTKPEDYTINELLQWFGGTLGLFNPRDKDKSCYRVFLALIKDLKQENQGLSSDDIAAMTKLSRGTVIHHLNRLMDAGMVIGERGRYSLRVENLEALVEEIRRYVNKTLDGLKDIAIAIDQQLDLS